MATLSPAPFTPGSGIYREDLSKRAPALVNPADAPVYKGLRKEKSTALLHEWLTDDLPANTLTDPILSTGEPTFSSTEARARVGNRIQTFLKTWSVSRVSQFVAAAGGTPVPDEVVREIERAMKSISKLIERTIMSEQAAATEGGGIGQKMGGFFSEHTTNVDDAAATALTTYVTETRLQDKIQDIYEDGGGGSLWLVCQPNLAKIVGTTFNGRTNARETTVRGERTVDTVVESYVAPVGGEVKITPNRSIGVGAAIIDKENSFLAELYPIRVYDVGDARRNREGWLETGLTYGKGNQIACGGWKNDSTPDASGE